MTTPEIRNFEEFLKSKLKIYKILNYTSRYLTAIGDNYGSTMLAVKIETENLDGKNETLDLVVKMPSENLQFRAFFQIEKTFIKESKIYTEMDPLFKKFQKEINVPCKEIYDCVAKCYGCRFSLDESSEVVDENALLVLENLKLKGYETMDREKGFDLEHCRIILKALAKFHAVPIALNKLRPELFKKHVLPYLEKLNMDASLDKEMEEKFTNLYLSDFKKCKDVEHLLPKFLNQLKFCGEWNKNLNPEIRSDFASIVHNDFWVNNMMIKYDNDRKPIHTKLVDFQVTYYGSFAHDLIFFCFTSTHDDVLENKLDKLFKIYYDEFLKCLELCGCSGLNETYTYDKFMDEINKSAPMEFLHIIMMLKVVYSDKKLLPDNALDCDINLLFEKEFVGPKYYKRINHTILEFERRNWFS